MPKKTVDLLEGQAAGLDRLSDHILRGSARPEQIAQAMRQTAAEIRRASERLMVLGVGAKAASKASAKLARLLEES